jgi:heterodisulfide reductase subunit C
MYKFGERKWFNYFSCTDKIPLIMKDKEEIPLNHFQLNVLLDKEREKIYNHLLENGVFCGTCKEHCTEGVLIEQIYLTVQNDIKITGKCKKCQSDVTRILEFGLDREFYKMADEFRESIQ